MILNCLNVDWDTSTGYGRIGYDLVRSLARAGVDVRPLTHEAALWPPDMFTLAAHPHAITLVCAQFPLFETLPTPQWVFTMWETTMPPGGWAQPIGEFVERVLVPAPFLADVFREAGVTAPISVLPLGIDPGQFPYIERNPERPLTFMALGDRGARKGWDKAYFAFKRAFPRGDEQVRFVIKARASGLRGLAGLDDARAIIWREDVESMAHVYAQADVFVFPTRGEGWGYPPREAAATGALTLATNWGGCAVELEHWGIPLNDYRLVRSGMYDPDNGETLGMWAEPDVDEIARHLQWCYENRDAMRDMARLNSDWIRRRQTVAQTTQKLISLLQEYGAQGEGGDDGA